LENGIETLQSCFSAKETMNRLVAAVEGAGLLVFAQIDHAKNAAEIGTILRPTELLVFGHPRGGTPLMLDHQLSAIDLPVKALVWQDEDDRVWLSFSTGTWIARRHGLGPQSTAAIAAIDDGLAKLAAMATGGPG
jgi:uncharacterized protein (DUF302 family)